MKTWLVVALVLMSFGASARDNDVAQPTSSTSDPCALQQQELSAASSIYDRDNSKSKMFFQSLSRHAQISAEIDEMRMKNALDKLSECHRQVAQAQGDAKARAEQAAYNARPEVIAMRKTIEKANAVTNGVVNVETFTPIEWLRGMGFTPWIPIGSTESKAFFYTYGAKDYETYINMKTATLGAGNNFTLIEFLAASVDCRPGDGYPAALSMPTTYSYAASGRPLLDDFTSPLGVEIPIEHGTVLAEAVIGTCDAVRAHHGTVNYASR